MSLVFVVVVLLLTAFMHNLYSCVSIKNHASVVQVASTKDNINWQL